MNPDPTPTPISPNQPPAAPIGGEPAPAAPPIAPAPALAPAPTSVNQPTIEPLIVPAPIPPSPVVSDQPPVEPISEEPTPAEPETPEYPPSTKRVPPNPRPINTDLVHYLGDFAKPEAQLPKIKSSSEPMTSETETKPSTKTAPKKESSSAPAVENTSLPADDVAAVDLLGKKYKAFKEELGKVIIGQEEVIEQLAICLFARGHGLLMGVPGLAKTLLVSSVAETLDLGFNRIQFTPDLMPADISGTDIIQEHSDSGKREFEFIKGPVFSNIVLADEINRAPAKTQSAMLEAMQERHVTVLGRTYKLDAPFFVLATQNPVEQEGTYPLPEAQLDRFMFLIEVDYPTAEEEKRIARETTGVEKQTLTPLLNGEEVLEFQSLVRRVPVPDHIYDYAVEIVRRTRPDSEDAPEWIKEFVGWGAGPRAVQYLILGCKARAALRGTYMASLEDIEAVAGPVLGHRILLNFAAESQGMTSKKIVARLVEEMRDDA